MSRAKSIAKGLQAAASSLMREEHEFSAAGKPVRCPHCGGSEFDKKRYQLTTAFRQGFMGDGASALVCRQCQRIEWFLGDV